jgi:His/Glu/Gln/Arg/opine family amino acid ABC transporter permease subunit
MLGRLSRGGSAPQPEQNLSSTLRFLGTVAAIVLVFGACGSIGLGALDKAQTFGAAPLTNLGALFGYVGHFFQVQVGILTTATDIAGTPYRNYFIIGLGRTIEFGFISMPLALVVGFALALMSRSRRAVLKLPARAYVEFFRNTPLIVQMSAIYFSLLFLDPRLLNPFTAGVAVLVLNYAAYECENLRAGFQALDRGQGEAAASLGLSYWQNLRLVTLPQIIAVVLPAVINDLIYMFKDSSILSLITIQELTSNAKDLGRRSPSSLWQIYILAALIYLVLSLPLARVARWVEGRLKSVSFVPKGDLSVMALQVLGGSLAIGWVCAVLIQGISLDSILINLRQIGAALVLIAGITVFTLVVLGGLVFIPYATVRQLRRPRTPPAVQASAETAVSVTR